MLSRHSGAVANNNNNNGIHCTAFARYEGFGEVSVWLDWYWIVMSGQLYALTVLPSGKRVLVPIEYA